MNISTIHPLMKIRSITIFDVSGNDRNHYFFIRMIDLQIGCVPIMHDNISFKIPGERRDFSYHHESWTN